MAVRTRRSGLNAETRRLLERLRRERPANPAYGKPVEVVKDEAHRVIDRLLVASGIDLAMANEVGWFVNGVAEALAYGRDEGLAFALEALVSKWVGLGLERNTAELVMRMVVREVGGVPDGITTKTPSHQEEGSDRGAVGGGVTTKTQSHKDGPDRVVDTGTASDAARKSSIGNAPEVEDETGE